MWDVCSDQEAVDLVRNIKDPQAASKALVEYALNHLVRLPIHHDQHAFFQIGYNKVNVGERLLKLSYVPIVYLFVVIGLVTAFVARGRPPQLAVEAYGLCVQLRLLQC